MRLERLLHWTCPTVLVVILAGCNASADNTANASSALWATARPGGVLACFGMRVESQSPANSVQNTQLDFTNHNDQGMITIDRVVLYSSSGDKVCEQLTPISLGPHQGSHYNLARMDCPLWVPPSATPRGAVSFIAYWSYGDDFMGLRNPLVGVSQIIKSDFVGGGILAATSFECKPITLLRDVGE